MAASSSDFTDLQEMDGTIAAQWPELVRAVQSLLAVFTAKVTDGSEPNDDLYGFVFALSGVKWRVLVSGNDLLIQEDVSGTWTTRDTYSASTGLTLAASRIVSGTFADARISESSVTQHEAALSIAASQLTGTLADARVAETNVTQHEGAIDHGSIAGLSDDDHTQYVKADGTRAFTGVVSGITPTASAHLTTKGYVDGQYAEEFETAARTIGSSETDLTDISGVSIPGADGSKKYRVVVNVEYSSSSSSTIRLVTVKVNVGANGTKADGTKFSFFANASFHESSGRIWISPSFTPATGDKIGLSANTNDDTVDIFGSSTASDPRTSIIIEELLGA